MSQLKPDYTRSLVNLMASLGQGLGAPAGDYPPLAEIPPESLRDKSILLLVIDGLGYEFLQRFPDSFLYRHLRGRLTSVFPSTTASAMTSYFTATGPQQHTITGWHTYLREIGSIATILPFVPRHGGAGYEQAGYSPEQFIGHPPLNNRIDVPSHVIYPEYIVDSAYSQSSSGNARRHGYTDMEEMFKLTVEQLHQTERQFVFSYWPVLDNLAHGYGVGSDEVIEHFRKLDRLCEHYLAPLAKKQPIFISADHGLIDSSPEQTLHLADHPQLARTLTLPFCGESRAVFCYVRAGHSHAFEEYVGRVLGHACELHRSEDLIAAGYFGLGDAHAMLAERVGDYTLLMKENYIFSDRLPHEKPFNLIGVHGGLSPQELFTPLIRL